MHLRKLWFKKTTVYKDVLLCLPTHGLDTVKIARWRVEESSEKFRLIKQENEKQSDILDKLHQFKFNQVLSIL